MTSGGGAPRRGRVQRLLIASVLASTLGVLWLVPAAARAGVGYVPSFSFAEEFSGPVGVAVDDSANPADTSKGDAYVVDQGHEALRKFSVSGTTATQEWKVELPGSTPNQAMVDDFAGSPDEGDVFVAGYGNGTIYRVNPAGTEVTEVLTGLANPTGVAVDSAGDFFVCSNSEGTVLEYNASWEPLDAAGMVVMPGENIVMEGLNGPQTLAVSATGEDIYAATGAGTIEATLVGSAYITSGTLDGASSNGVTVAPAGDVFVDQGGEVAIYEPSGTRVGRFGSGVLSGGAYGVGVSASAAFVADNGANDVDVFAAGATPETPETLPASTVTDASAVLNGNLKLAAGESTVKYLFEYNTGSSCSGGTSTPVKEGDGVVSEAIAGLSLGTEYTFCLLAVNGFGETVGGPETFTTVAVGDEDSPSVTAGEASVSALVATGGETTSYKVQYGTANVEEFASTEVSVPGASAPIPVEQRLAGLKAATTYRFRFLVSNGHGHAIGEERSFTTHPAPGSEPAQNCTNEARRIEQSSTYLPDCRAYELVSPAEKGSGEPAVKYEGVGAHAAADGERMAWFAQSDQNVPGSATLGLIYLSTRGADGWSSEDTIPPQSVENGLLCPEYVGIDAWSANLETGVLADGLSQAGGSKPGFSEEEYECGHDEPRLVAGEREGFQNLFVRDNENFLRDGEAGVNPYQLVNVTPSAVPPPEPNGTAQYHSAFFLAGSADLSHVVFEDELPLTEESEHLTKLGEPEQEEFEAACKEVPKGRACWEGHDDLYEWTASGVHLVTLLPDGAPVEGSLAGATKNAHLFGEPYNVADYLHAVSEAGSRVFFQAGGNLYLRENAEREQSALTPAGTLVNGEQCTEREKACTIQVDASQASGPGGGGEFMEASATGSRVFFTDENRLTSDSTAQAGKPDLYEYDLEKPVGERLSDLTADSAEPADVLGVSGAGEDGSRVYFVARGVLSAEPDRSLPQGRQTPVAGEPNLYAYEPSPAAAGAYRTMFIATLAGGDSCDWIEIGCGPSVAGLTARVSASGAFLGFTSAARLTSYDNTDANTHNPDDEIYLYDAATETLGCASCDPGGAAPTGGAAIGPPVTSYNSSWPTDAYPQRYVSDNGQVFFDSAEALLPAATNAESNVYEYEGGGLHLISSGTSDEASYFLDASVSGSDVFFETAQQLLGETRDAAYAIYDARVDGGFPEPAAPVAQCASNEGCTGAGGPESDQSALSTPASASLLGAGNLTPAPVVAKPKGARAPDRAQKLAKALKACRKDEKKTKRKRCEASARRKYGTKRAEKSAKTKRGGK